MIHENLTPYIERGRAARTEAMREYFRELRSLLLFWQGRTVGRAARNAAVALQAVEAGASEVAEKISVRVGEIGPDERRSPDGARP